MSNSIESHREDKYRWRPLTIDRAGNHLADSGGGPMLAPAPLTNNHKDLPMTDQPSTGSPNVSAPTPMQARAEAKLLRSEIGNKWGKFTTQELDDLKNNDELVAALVAKYGLAKDAATRDAAAVVQGRAF